MVRCAAARRKLRRAAESLDSVLVYGVHPGLMAHPEGFTIGELAALSGVGVETVRFYERQHLLVRPAKPSRGYRRYPAATLQRIEFIRRAKALGFTLDEIRELLELRAREGAPCTAVRERAIAKREAIDAKIRELEALRASVQQLVDVCTGSVAVEQCSILGALDGVQEPEERTVSNRTATRNVKGSSRSLTPTRRKR